MCKRTSLKKKETLWGEKEEFSLGPGGTIRVALQDSGDLRKLQGKGGARDLKGDQGGKCDQKGEQSIQFLKHGVSK